MEHRHPAQSHSYAFSPFFSRWKGSRNALVKVFSDGQGGLQRVAPPGDVHFECDPIRAVGHTLGEIDKPHHLIGVWEITVDDFHQIEIIRGIISAVPLGQISSPCHLKVGQGVTLAGVGISGYRLRGVGRRGRVGR